MSNISFDNFGNFGKNHLDFASGRSSWMKNKVKFIVKDILQKLNINKSDDVLDVGCGDAKILNNIKPFARSVTGIDHHLIVNKLKKKFNDKIIFIEGDIKKDHTKVKKKFNKILIYSVIHYLKDDKELFKVIRILLSKLNSSGMLLIGDVPNKDMKKRFQKTNEYKIINREWIKNIHKISTKEKNVLKNMEQDKKIIFINDKLIHKIFKKYNNKNFGCFILNQNNFLLQNNTRLDILIKKI